MRPRPAALLPIAALLMLGGAVFLLRGQVDAVSAPTWEINDPLIAEQAQSVDYRPDHPAPAAPPRLEIDSWDAESLRVRWGSALPGEDDPAQASGYEVGWSGGGRTGQLLVASPAAEIHDLDPRTPYAVEVRSVNALGERSAPARATARPAEVHRHPPLPGLDVVRDFAEYTLDGDHWQPGDPRCLPHRLAEGGIGAGPECGMSSLRHRAPFVLTEPDEDDVRGRILLRSDGVSADPWVDDAQTAGLSITLTPTGYGDRGPLFLTAPPDQAVATAAELPPGGLGLTLTRGGPKLLLAPGLTAEGGDIGHLTTFSSATGVRSLWELRFESTRLVVLQDEIPVTSVPVRVPWEEADLSVSFNDWSVTGPALEVIGLSAVDDDVRMDVVPVDQAAGDPPPLPIESSHHLLTAAHRAEFVSALPMADGVTLLLDGEAVPMERTPSTEPGHAWIRADLPVASLRANPAGLTVAGAEGVGSPTTGRLHVWSEPSAEPAEAHPLSYAAPTTPALPAISARVRGDGGSIDVRSPGASVPRGELTITLLVDGHHHGGRTSHVLPAAGFDVLADDDVLLRVPAHEDGPMVGGLHEITVDVSDHPQDTLTLRAAVHGLTADEVEAAPIARLRLTG